MYLVVRKTFIYLFLDLLFIICTVNAFIKLFMNVALSWWKIYLKQSDAIKNKQRISLCTREQEKVIRRQILNKLNWRWLTCKYKIVILSEFERIHWSYFLLLSNLFKPIIVIYKNKNYVNYTNLLIFSPSLYN